MNKRKWLTLLGGMLMAFFLVMGLSPPRVSAVYVENPVMTDDMREKARLLVDNFDVSKYCSSDILTKYPQSDYRYVHNAYILYYDTYEGRYILKILAEPVYVRWGSDEPMYAMYPTDSPYFTYKTTDVLVDVGFKYQGTSRGFEFWYDRSNWSQKKELSFQLYIRDCESCILASNFGFRNKDHKLFFCQQPLAAKWLQLADSTLQEKLVEVREGRPHLPQLGQIQTGLIVVVCCLVSLTLLNKLLRVWKNSLIR